MDQLAIKKSIQKKNPTFLRQDGHKRKKLKAKWRRPKGIHSKMRDKRRGYRVVVSTGYGTPKALRTFNKEGKKEYVIANMKDLAAVPQNSHIVFASSLGDKIKIAMIEEAKKKKLIIVNMDVELFLKNLQAKKDAKKKKQEQLETKKKKKTLEQNVEDKAKKEEEKEAPEETDEEKKKKEKEERDKVLTKKT